MTTISGPEAPATPPLQATLPGEPPRIVTAQGLLASRGGRRFHRAVDDTGAPWTLVERDGPALEPGALSKIRDSRVLRPVHTQTTPTGTLQVFPRPQAVSIPEWLADPSAAPAALDVLTFGLRLCDVMESIHGAGHCVLSLDPDAVLRTPQLDAILAGVGEDLPVPGQLPKTLSASTAAPEVMHRLAPLCGITSDVFSVAALLHALLARHPLWIPPTGMSAAPVHMHSPRVWRQDLPLGIWPRLAPALDPDPARRTPHMAALKTLLSRARKVVSARTFAQAMPWRVDGWADSHIGVGKARRGGDQQDRLFCGVGQTGRMVLCAVADGVSHATLGDGGTAAEHTITAVRALFDQIHSGAAPADGVTTLQELLSRRHSFLTTTHDKGSAAITQDANLNFPPLKGDPAGVMASTLVMALVEDGVATVLNVGDSRAYLFDGETCEAITVDHDRRTEAVRAGMDPYAAMQLEAAGALTRAVGRSTVLPDGKLRSSPSTPDLYDLPLRNGDRIILCSDGLPDYATPVGKPVINPVGIEQVIARHVGPAMDPAQAAHDLIGLANRHGGHDNIAVVAVFVGSAQ